MDDGAEAADAEPANALVPASCGNEIRASAPHGGARIRCEYPLRTTLNIDEKPTNLDENEAFEFDDISRKMFSRVELQRFHKSEKKSATKDEARKITFSATCLNTITEVRPPRG